MPNKITRIVLELLSEYTVSDAPINSNNYVYKDLKIYGDDFHEFLTSLSFRLQCEFSAFDYDELMESVPTERATLFSHLFANKKNEQKDVQVGQLVSQINRIVLRTET